MATKTFSTTLKFNRKSTDSLLNALGNTKKTKLDKDLKVKVVKGEQAVVDFFKKLLGRISNGFYGYILERIVESLLRRSEGHIRYI